MNFLSFLKTIFSKKELDSIPSDIQTESGMVRVSDLKTISPTKENKDSRDELMLMDLHPYFAGVVRVFLQHCYEAGLNVGVQQGFRSFDLQQSIYNKGRDAKGNVIAPKRVVTHAKPGQSFHNYGLAVDIVFKTFDGVWSWSENHPWSALGKLGKECGLEWGGDWLGKKNDRPHFQLSYGYKWQDLLKFRNEGGIELVWQKINEQKK